MKVRNGGVLFLILIFVCFYFVYFVYNFHSNNDNNLHDGQTDSEMEGYEGGICDSGLQIASQLPGMN